MKKAVLFSLLGLVSGLSGAWLFDFIKGKNTYQAQDSAPNVISAVNYEASGQNISNPDFISKHYPLQGKLHLGMIFLTGICLAAGDRYPAQVQG